MSERDWWGGWGDRDEISVDEIDAMYPAAAHKPNRSRRRPRFLLHISRVAPDMVLAEGLRTDAPRNFGGVGVHGFNTPGIYFYDAIPTTRRLFPRSRVHLFCVDMLGLALEQDAWGGQGAWISRGSVAPERIRHVHTYERFERPLATRHPLGLHAHAYQRPAAVAA